MGEKVESLRRKVLMTNTTKNGLCTGDMSNGSMALCDSGFKSPSDHLHKYMGAILKIWKQDPEPEKLYKIKQWEKWVQDVAALKFNERNKFLNERALKPFASALQKAFLNDRNPYFLKAHNSLDDCDGKRLLQLKENFWNSTIKKQKHDFSENDSSPECIDIDDDNDKDNPSLNTTFITSPKCIRDKSPERIFKKFSPSRDYVSISPRSNHSPGSLSRKRNNRRDSDPIQDRKKLCYENPLPSSLKITRVRRHSGSPSCRDDVSVQSRRSGEQKAGRTLCYQDENCNKPKCIEEQSSKTNKLDHVDEYSFHENSDDDLVIENPTPPCSPACTSLSTETEVVRRNITSKDNSRSIDSDCRGIASVSSLQEIPAKDFYSNSRSKETSEPKANKNRRIKGIRSWDTNQEPLTQKSVDNNVHNNSADFELPDIEGEATLPIDQDKENYPVTVDEIAVKYPKPPSAPALTLEMFEELKLALDRPPKDKIINGSLFSILQEDLAVYNKDTEWLSDRNIDFYLEMIQERSKKDGYPRVYIFQSYFYTLLTDKAGGYSVVEDTTGEDDIFKYDIVFFPVNLNQHWRLVVAKFNEKSLKCYDSMRHNNADVLRSIGHYLKREYRRKHQSSTITSGYVSEDDRMSPICFANDDVQVTNKVFFDSSLWTVENVSNETIPQQKNAIDCGIFLLQYAEYLSREKEFEFDQSHIPYFRKRMMYETLKKQLLTSLENENVEKPVTEENLIGA